MSAPSFLERARDLDLDIRVLDALIARATSEAHPKVVTRLLKRRAADVQAWGKMWGTKKVAQ